MAKTITLIRHAETNANRVSRWQGHADAGLSPHGEMQLVALGARRNGHKPSVLVASDLPRTMRTASVLGNPTPNPAWREFHVGDWEGLTSPEITDRYPEQWRAFFNGEDVAPGGGELMSEFGARIVSAFDELIASIDDGEHATVVTHGGAIWAVMGHVLGIRGPLKLIPSHNTASTIIRVEPDGHRQISVFNDASHLQDLPTQFGPEGTMISIFRHGQSQANVEGRWQGRTNSPLTERGRRQVEEAATTAPAFSELFTSPLGRTVETAEIIGANHGIGPLPADGLIEMAFGQWEDMTTDEAVAEDPELFASIYERGQDMPRGHNGESFGGTGERIRSTLEDLVTEAESDHIGAVSHGAAIRAYITNVLGIPFAERNRLPIPRNSSLSQIRQSAEGPVLAAYNVAPHLDNR